MGRLVTVTMALLLVCLCARAQQPAFMDMRVLAEVKAQLQTHRASAQTQLAWEELQRQADRALDAPLMSVTEKGQVPLGGTRHDYLSISAYWWPDPHNPQGRWIRRDGEINPASKNNQSDGVRLAAFTARLQSLTLAWYFSGQPRYAQKALELMRHWFIEPESRMNPNLNWAQGVPGMATGRSTGILDGRYFATRVVDSLILLRQAPGWHESDEQQMQAWMTDYLGWLQNSPQGKREARAKNNHGSWYNVQVAGIAWYVRQPATVRAQVTAARARMDHQILADGTQPLELARTRSFHYSIFNLQALVALATLADKSSADDLWRPARAGGVGILTALDFMAPWTDDNRVWPYPSRDRISARLIPLLSQADNHLHSLRYRRDIEKATFTPGQTDSGHAQRGALISARRDTWLLALPDFSPH